MKGKSSLVLVTIFFFTGFELTLAGDATTPSLRLFSSLFGSGSNNLSKTLSETSVLFSSLNEVGSALLRNFYGF